jgi:hypothetical protein
MERQENSGMPMIEKQLMSYSEIRERQKTHMLIRSEVPIEHAISLPLPTMAWGEPAFAYFAAPAVRRPETPMQQGAPDRWWVVAAHGGRLMVYALCKSIHFTADAKFETVTLPRITITRDELRQSMKTVEGLIGSLAPRFFAYEPGDAMERKNLADMLNELLPKPLQPQYRALVPDFFAWLEK